MDQQCDDGFSSTIRKLDILGLDTDIWGRDLYTLQNTIHISRGGCLVVVG